MDTNFQFLENIEPQLMRLGALAERYFPDDPNTSLMKLRQFGELLAQNIAAQVGEYDEAVEKDESQSTPVRLDRL